MGIVRNVVGSLVVGGIAIFAGTAADEDKTTRDEAGAITESGGLGVFKMKVGDCIGLPGDDAEEAQSVEGVPCAEPHDGQVYDEFTLTSADLPGKDELSDLAFNGCAERFFPATGMTMEQAEQHDIYFFTPTRESWDALGDRLVTCIVISLDGAPLVGDKVQGGAGV